MRIKNIGFIATRISGNDGVSLEIRKWDSVFRRIGYNCFYFAGKLDTPPEKSFLAEEAYFKYPEIQEIHRGCFDVNKREHSITEKIDKIKNTLIDKINTFIKEYDIDLLIVENAFAIPLNIPLAIALTQYITENNFMTIGHHHDFYWERDKFSLNVVDDYLKMAFPPDLKSIEHVVISSMADKQLSYRTGISATIIPNVMDFENPPKSPDDYSSDIKDALGITNEYFILQPTRIVKRKGIEHSMELVRELQELGLKSKLVITYSSGDEGSLYEKRLRRFSELMQVDTLFISDIISDKRDTTTNGRKIYSIQDIYSYADLVTYPSTFEGFGNAFLETIYYSKPIVLNNYSVYHKDIGPKGFKVIELPGFVTPEAVDLTRNILENSKLANEWAEHNYALGKKFYSYSILEKALSELLRRYESL